MLLSTIVTIEEGEVTTIGRNHKHQLISTFIKQTTTEIYQAHHYFGEAQNGPPVEPKTFTSATGRITAMNKITLNLQTQWLLLQTDTYEAQHSFAEAESATTWTAREPQKVN